MEPLHFFKYHGLGNDYLIVADYPVTPHLAQRLCDRRRGVGADGVLVPSITANGIAVRIINPDGSEAEKSGNGLRILARWLWDQGRVGSAPFPIHTAGGTVQCQILNHGQQVSVEMGRASFMSNAIGVAGAARSLVDVPIDVDSQPLRFTGVSIGNPHCVIVQEAVSEAQTRALGPHLETHPLFQRRTNVQFMQPLDQHRIRIEIWERGAGYTLASGSSSCAAAAAAMRLGLARSPITVRMPGGELVVTLDDSYDATLLGPVAAVMHGIISPEWLETPA